METYKKSMEMTRKFNEYYPGGHTNFNVPDEFVHHKIFVESCEGAHLFDIDGNEFIEYNNSMGPMILGHRNPEMMNHIKSFLDTHSTAYGSGLLYTTADIDLAEAIIRNVPCAEQLKFCVTGSEANQMAMRIARGHTGKNRILRFTGHYCGWFDNVLDDIAKDPRDGLPLAAPTPESDTHFSEGKSPWAHEESFIVQWNNFDAFEYVMDKYHDEIAMVLFEPIACNSFCMYPKPGFLEKIRELCTKYDAVMGFDEIITGWRLGLSGAQGYFGVTPDICTMGKAISGGLPFSAIAGKKEIMSVFTRKKILGPGTFNGYALGISATLKNIELLEKDDGAAYKSIALVQDRLMNGFVELAAKYGQKIRISAAPGVFFTLFGVEGGISPVYTMKDLVGLDRDFMDRLRYALQTEGIITLRNLRFYVGASHTLNDAEITLTALEKSLRNLTK